MGAIHKGKAGEREFCNWLDKNFNLPDKPERNLEQARSGGIDIIYPPFAFEVKRREALDLQSWWIQCKTGALVLDLEPVVAFRQNRKLWQFLISASHISCEKGFILLNESVFKAWVHTMWSDA